MKAQFQKNCATRIFWGIVRSLLRGLQYRLYTVASWLLRSLNLLMGRLLRLRLLNELSPWEPYNSGPRQGNVRQRLLTLSNLKAFH